MLQTCISIAGGTVAQPSFNSHWLSQWEPFIFDPQQNRRPLTDQQKNLSHVIMSTTFTAVQNFVEIRPWGASGHTGEI